MNERVESIAQFMGGLRPHLAQAQQGARAERKGDGQNRELGEHGAPGEVEPGSNGLNHASGAPSGPFRPR